MNTHGINSAELNGSSGHFIVSVLGSASSTLEFVAFERALTKLSGSAGITFGALGDVTKMSQLGVTSTGLNFSESVSLSKFAVVGLGYTTSTLTFTGLASITAVKPLADATIGITFSTAASLYLVGGMAASATLALDVTSIGGPQITRKLGDITSMLSLDATASLTQYVKQYIGNASVELEFDVTGALIKYVKNYLPSVTAPITFDANGNLTNYARISTSQSGLTFTANAVLANYIYLHGASGIEFTTDASLFNNPNAYDPPANVLTRPYVDRIMVRQ